MPIWLPATVSCEARETAEGVLVVRELQCRALVTLWLFSDPHNNTTAQHSKKGKPGSHAAKNVFSSHAPNKSFLCQADIYKNNVILIQAVFMSEANSTALCENVSSSRLQKCQAKPPTAVIKGKIRTRLKMGA